MKKFTKVLLFILVIVSNSLAAQIRFKPAFFLDNSENKIDCLIKDVDWKSNPVTFEYKISENDAIQIGRIENVQEFQIGDLTKYVRKTVDIDRWDKFSAPTVQKQPVYQSETLFLKTLVEGKATLYTYSDGSLTTYFYSIEDGDTKQLVQKQYVSYNGSKDVIYKNDLYKNLLKSDLNTPSIKNWEIDNLDYFKANFVRLFQKYNGDEGQGVALASAEKTKLHVTPRIGLSINQVEVNHLVYAGYQYDFGTKSNFRFGLELEAVLPFNRGECAVALERAFTSYKADSDGSDWTADINYQALELHAVLRHYMFLNDNSKLFLNAGFVYSTDVNNAMYSPIRRPDPVAIDMNFQLVFGAGYKYKKLSAEIRYIGDQSMIINHSTWQAHYTSYSFVLGYELM